jgi:hypothetical protein
MRGSQLQQRLGRVSLAILILSATLAAAPATFEKDDSPPQATGGTWQVIKQDQGITVERRKIEGSPLVEFKGHGVVDASVMEILAVISDTKNHPKWVAN